MLRVRGLPELMPPYYKEIEVRQSAQLGDFQDFFITGMLSTLQLSWLVHPCKQLQQRLQPCPSLQMP